MEKNKIDKIIENVSLFKNCNKEVMKDIISKLETIPYKKGEYIFKQGDLSDYMFIILNGDVDLYASNQYLISRSKYWLIGELGLMDEAPRTASAKCVSDELEIIKIDENLFHELIKVDKSIFRNLLRIITEKFRKAISRESIKSEKGKSALKRSVELELKNKDLQTFAYMLSHELKSPLQKVIGFLELTKDDVPRLVQDENYKELLEIAYNNILRMSTTIDSILGFSKAASNEIKIQEINLSGISKDVFNRLKITSQIEKNIEFIVEDDLKIIGDENLMFIAIENLISNALKYTKNREHPRIEIGTGIINGEKIYFIRDNGIGFDMKNYNKLFEPFKQLHNFKKIEGTGIGLSTVARILKRHGGDIWAESEADKGTTFYFYTSKPDDTSKEEYIKYEDFIC